ncbi:MAG: heparinase, partial [Pseudomonadota bacterium]|nr:heparinase [Pseudomonadota bacterium]
MSDEGDVIGKLARGSLMSRLFTAKKEPLRLIAVPRDHIAGDRARGDALLAGRFTLGTESVDLADFDFAGLGADSKIATSLQGFSWLRDLAASTGRDKGARLAEALVGRWLLAHGTKV